MWWWYLGRYVYGLRGWIQTAAVGPEWRDLQGGQMLIEGQYVTPGDAPTYVGLWRYAFGSWELFTWRQNY